MIKEKEIQQKQYQSLVEDYVKKINILKDASVSQLKSPIDQFEFYHVQIAKFPFHKGIVCAINDQIVIWSNKKNAFQLFLKYLNAGDPLKAFSVEQFTTVFQFFEKNEKILTITKSNIEFYKTHAKTMGYNIAIPEMLIEKGNIRYTFWKYALLKKQFRFYDFSIDENHIYNLKVNEKNQEMYPMATKN